MIRENRIINKLSAWYFSKKVLPYWAILLMDALIMFVSVVFTYWVANRSQVTFEHSGPMPACFATAAPWTSSNWPMPTA